jgi:glutathione S-transferase
VARAFARSITAEMHAGFSTLRGEMTTCIRERVDVRPWSPRLVADIARITAIWDEARRRFGQGGAYLCGRYSLADVFFGPVAFRFQTYDVHPEGAAGAYLASLLAHPHLQEWERAALAETMVIEADEPRVLYRDKIVAGSRA